MIKMFLSDGSDVIYRYPDFGSKFVLPRHVDIWLPPGYHTDSTRHYPVVYMHDGQNLFDSVLAYAGVDWGMDEAITRLMGQKLTTGAIIVGAWNTPRRLFEYMPQKPVAKLLQNFALEHEFPPESDAYLRFLAEELKPYVDSTYRTHPDQAHTFVMGSSMGGLISLYALTEYPHLFGGAGCLSTHWVIGGNPLVDYFAGVLPSPGKHKLYFDYGTGELDHTYEPFQKRMDQHMKTAGYREDQDWMSRRFEGANHNESAWRARVDLPLSFLLTGL